MNERELPEENFDEKMEQAGRGAGDEWPEHLKSASREWIVFYEKVRERFLQHPTGKEDK